MRPGYLALTALACAATVGCATTRTAAPTLTPREEAQLALRRGDGGRALALLGSELRAHPDDLALARLEAEAHVKAGTDEAFVSRLAADDTARSHYQQGLVRFARAAEASGPAITEFQRAVELSPQEPEFHYRLGVALLESEHYVPALAALTEAVRLSPARTAWNLPLAKARARNGDRAGAVAAIRSAVEGRPTPEEARTAIALMDELSDPFVGFPQAARPQLEQAMQWLQLADVPQEAITQLEEVLHDYPDVAVAHTLLGLAFNRLDDAGRAVDELRRAIELAPDDGKNHFYLAELYRARQRPKEAEAQYRLAVDLNPVLTEAWRQLGEAALGRRDLIGAKQAFEIVTWLEPDAPASRGKLALVYQLDGDWAAAERELRAVVDADPKNLEFVLRLGVLQAEHFSRARSPAERETARQEAQRWLRQVLEAQPENALASRALERVSAR